MSKTKKIIESVVMFIGVMGLLVLGNFLVRLIPYELTWWVEIIGTGLFWLLMLVVIGLFFSGTERQFYQSINQTLTEIGKGNFNVDLSPQKKQMARFSEWTEFLDQMQETSDKLAEMEKIKQSFISNVSHEIRSPLTSISGFAQLAKGETDETKRDYYLETINQECLRLSKLSDSLLKLTELENTDKLRKQPIDVAVMLNQVVESMAIQLNEKRLNLEVNVIDLTYEGDPVLFYQIWQNLLGNAIKFSPDGETVTLTVKGSIDKWAISVSDRGCGISKDNQAQLFDRFYMVDDSRNADMQGNGLGLSIVKGIVDLHEDLEIEVESAEGEGATFTVTKK